MGNRFRSTKKTFQKERARWCTRACNSGAEITIDLQGTGRTWRAPSCDATNCFVRYFARGSGKKLIFSSSRRSPFREIADDGPATARDDGKIRGETSLFKQRLG